MSERHARGLVVEARSGFIDVATADGVVRCRVRGRLKQGARRSDLCVIGDEVEILLGRDGGVVEEVLPRRTRFSRRHPGKGGQHREDVLVANLDRLFAVFAFGDPPFHHRMLDRFLVIAEHNDVEPVVVANKVDQEEPATRAVFESYGALGYRVLFTSAKRGDGLEELRELLQDRISAFVGPSGAGKSSLVNAVEPGLGVAIGDTSAAHGKGRHTTRVATLHPLSFGGYVADTPGIRELGTFALPELELARCFPEMRPHLGTCGFRSCLHDSEPSCAVKDAVETGAIREERYDSYLRLLHPDDDA